MKLVTDAAPLFTKTLQAHERAVEDVLTEARRRAPKRTGKFAASIRATKSREVSGVFSSVVGSPLSSARVKEKGGYMQARRHSTLFIPAGDGTVRRPVAVRVRAQPTVTPAAEKYPEYASRRLREMVR